MAQSRRAFLTGATALAFSGWRLFQAAPASAQPVVERYGSLTPDPLGLLDLPRGFSYKILSRAGEPMSDGLLTPSDFDGMACFPTGIRNKVVLVRNHEIWPDSMQGGAFGDGHSLMSKVARDKIYDFAPSGAPKLGGTTTLLYDLKSKKVERSFLSLAGTCGNCAGGPTPWGSWLSCEETLEKPSRNATRAHGYVFEVPSRARGLVDPVPLKAMGRFIHEAAAVDPATGVVYMTEDRPDGLFYRFLPDRRGVLSAGGTLQALALRKDRERDFRNWPRGFSRFPGDGETVRAGEQSQVAWITLSDVDSPDGDLKDRGFAKGALRFARGEGLAVGAGLDGKTEIYISCTMGGAKRIGQVWRYRPSVNEGSKAERDNPGTLELFVETNDKGVLQNCDNVAVAPWGDLILCEDGPSNEPQHLRGVTPEGALYPLARNALSEFAGACFSPDGGTMFVNMQRPSITFAIEGPWRV